MIISTRTDYYAFEGRPVAMKRGSQFSYFGVDHLGSTRLVTDATGTQVARMDYDPFGGELRAAGKALSSDKTYTHQRTEDFGLMDYNARYYDPMFGRFISADSIVPQPNSPMGWDRYSYAKFNPVIYIDPDGHVPCAATNPECGDQSALPLFLYGGMTKNELLTYQQYQTDHPTGCGPFSLAMAGNLLHENPDEYNGEEIERILEDKLIKLHPIGIPANNFQTGVEAILGGVNATYLSGNNVYVDDIISQLEQGNLVIVTVSWQSNRDILRALGNGEPITVGHYMVLVGYDYQNGKLIFLDPGKSKPEKDDKKEFKYYDLNQFTEIWKKQPNIAIPPASTTVLE